MKGICSICLEERELTYEHVPPKRVFNDKPAVAHTIYGMQLGSKFEKPPALLKRPQGLGHWTLCESCNGKTGDWYGPAFAEWTKECFTYAQKFRVGGGSVLLPFHMQPLNVIKQVVVMALAVSGLKTTARFIDGLRRFVLSRQSMELPTDCVIKTYFNPEDPARENKPILTQNRLSGACGVLDVSNGTSVFVLAEIAFPPMGYVIYTAEPTARVSPDFTELCDLTRLKRFYYGQRVTAFLDVPIRYPFGPVPGYYPNLNKGNVRFLDDNHVLLS